MVKKRKAKVICIIKDNRTFSSNNIRELIKKHKHNTSVVIPNVSDIAAATIRMTRVKSWHASNTKRCESNIIELNFEIVKI